MFIWPILSSLVENGLIKRSDKTFFNSDESFFTTSSEKRFLELTIVAVFD